MPNTCICIYTYLYLYIYTYVDICLMYVYEVRFHFWSGVSTLGFGEWGIVFHVLALCLVQKTDVLTKSESAAAS